MFVLGVNAGPIIPEILKELTAVTSFSKVIVLLSGSIVFEYEDDPEASVAAAISNSGPNVIIKVLNVFLVTTMSEIVSVVPSESWRGVKPEVKVMRPDCWLVTSNLLDAILNTASEDKIVTSTYWGYKE